MTQRKKLIEVALPLEAINAASAREKSIRHGHPSTLHLWWARRPLAAARAVIFTSLVDDPGHHPDADNPVTAPSAFIDACMQLPKGRNSQGVDENGRSNDTPRMRLFDFIERLVTWEATTDEAILEQARELIRLSTDGNPPPLLDPFAGGGSIPLEAQRLGLEAHASDLNPVAVMINKAMIEIPPRFADMPPVNPTDRSGLDLTLPSPPAPLPAAGEGSRREQLEISVELQQKMVEVAREFRKEPTPSEAILWDSLRNRQLEDRKFRRQQPIGPFVVDFFCAAERLVVEVDGSIHAEQQEADAKRQALIEATGLRFIRVTAEQVETDLPNVLDTIRTTFLPSPAAGRGAGGEGNTKTSVWKGAAGLAADVRYYGEWMRERAWEKIGHLYPTHNGETVIAWLWARTVKSPNPAVDAHVPLVKSFLISNRKNDKAWIEPDIDTETSTINFRIDVGNGKSPKGTMNRSGGECIISGVPIPWEYLREQGQSRQFGTQMMAFITEGLSGRNYHSPNIEQCEIAASAVAEWFPEFPVSTNPQYMGISRYGINTFADLFTPRQATALSTFSNLISDVKVEVIQASNKAGLTESEANKYARAVITYLSFAIDKCTDYWTMIATWMPRGTVGHAFTRQAMGMTWDFPEANPFSDFHCSWLNACDWVAKVLEKFVKPIHVGKVVQKDAGNLQKEPNPTLVSTDPPYYDNVPYADVSDFFYVWMRHSLQDEYPNLFSTMLVPKDQELVANAVRHGSKEAGEIHFEQGMINVFDQLYQRVDWLYPITVYYAFKQTETDTADLASSTGWEIMLEGLVRSRFRILGTWPVRTERAARTRGLGSNALASSIVLVCRPRPDDALIISRRDFVAALQQELPPALRDMQSGNIAPVDLAQASIGPGMAVYSRYSKVLEADGSPLTVRTALQLINQELDAFLSEQEGDIDADTRFAVEWFKQYGFEEGRFGDADVLARAKNVSVEGLVQAGVVESGAGKVRLKHWNELDAGIASAWNPTDDDRATVWEAAHHLIERLETRGESGAARLLLKMNGDMAAEARQLAYRLYSICERKSRAEHARAYNALVISWPGIQDAATELKQQQASGQATEQGTLFE